MIQSTPTLHKSEPSKERVGPYTWVAKVGPLLAGGTGKSSAVRIALKGLAYDLTDEQQVQYARVIVERGSEEDKLVALRAPSMTNREALDLLLDAIKRSDYSELIGNGLRAVLDKGHPVDMYKFFTMTALKTLMVIRHLGNKLGDTLARELTLVAVINCHHDHYTREEFQPVLTELVHGPLRFNATSVISYENRFCTIYFDRVGRFTGHFMKDVDESSAHK